MDKEVESSEILLLKLSYLLTRKLLHSYIVPFVHYVHHTVTNNLVTRRSTFVDNKVSRRILASFFNNKFYFSEPFQE